MLCAPLLLPQKSWDDVPSVHDGRCAAFTLPAVFCEIVIRSASRYWASAQLTDVCWVLCVPASRVFVAWPGRPDEPQVSALILNSLSIQVHRSPAVLRTETLKRGGKAGKRNSLRRCRIAVSLPGGWEGGNRAFHVVGSAINTPGLGAGFHIVFAGRWEVRSSCVGEWN